jgi:hypothetical protein
MRVVLYVLAVLKFSVKMDEAPLFLLSQAPTQNHIFCYEKDIFGKERKKQSTLISAQLEETDGRGSCKRPMDIPVIWAPIVARFNEPCHSLTTCKTKSKPASLLRARWKNSLSIIGSPQVRPFFSPAL